MAIRYRIGLPGPLYVTGRAGSPLKGLWLVLVVLPITLCWLVVQISWVGCLWSVRAVRHMARAYRARRSRLP